MIHIMYLHSIQNRNNIIIANISNYAILAFH